MRGGSLVVWAWSWELHAAGGASVKDQQVYKDFTNTLAQPA